MLTPQEVSNHAFAKAVMGGYNMAMVDEFLDELTDDYTSLYKENAALKAKMKVLVDKVEEYRSTEDAMRAALLTAQKMADSMVAEAEEKKKSLLENAENEANRKIGAPAAAGAPAARPPTPPNAPPAPGPPATKPAHLLRLTPTPRPYTLFRENRRPSTCGFIFARDAMVGDVGQT